MSKRGIGYTALLTCLLLTGGCSIKPAKTFTGHDEAGYDKDRDSAPTRRLDPDSIPDAVPKHEPRSKRGNPDSYVVFGKRYYVMQSSQGYNEKGIASWYGTKFHGRLTSSGEPYDMYKMTAAHKSLPLPTYVEVTNLKNGQRIIVKVNDRGPFHGKRIIDLSYAAATKLGILGEGTGLVQVRALQPGEPATNTIASTPAPQPSITDATPELFLQIGAFSSRLNADKLRQRLAPTVNAPIRIENGESNGHAVYRVQLGPFSRVELIDNFAAQLNTLGISDSHVVIK
ncbi:MAG: septal ring lytic transglycosylase RlpA family protein [Chromatiales bacterium]|nr:septal ring lytic transglycosylase RlpA family protein [Chromatiales bacterium]